MECRFTCVSPVKGSKLQEPVKVAAFMQRCKTAIYAWFSPAKQFETFLVDHAPAHNSQIEKLSQLHALSTDTFNLLTEFLDTQSVLALLTVHTTFAWRLCVNRQAKYSLYSIFIDRMVLQLSSQGMTRTYAKQLDKFQEKFRSIDAICHQVQRLNLVEFMCASPESFAFLTNSATVFRYFTFFPNIQQLDLSKHSSNKDPLMDMAFAKIAQKIPRLEHLELNDQHLITDVTVGSLSKIPFLKTLSLRKCERLTDKSMVYLEGLPQLKQVDVIGCTQMTAPAKDRLREKGCIVIDGT